ncbi:MAG: hypothetical protein KIT68_04920 [Phycisphaeraceae bacterium]|nr:hypothetical protein [Phycisphaeraceae bacterium]
MVAEAQQNAQRAFAAVETVPLSSIPDNEALRTVLARVKLDADQVDTPTEDVHAVVAAATDLFAHRFMRKDPAGYIAWRKSAGYRFRTRDQILKAGGEAASYEAAAGAPPRDDQTLEEIFAAVWRYVEANSDASTKPAYIASVPEGLAIRFGELDPSGPRRYPRPVGIFGTALWMAPVSGGYTMWFAPPCDVGALLKSRVRVRSATFSAIVECVDSSRYALTFRMVQDPDSRRWYVAAVSLYAAPHGNIKDLF